MALSPPHTPVTTAEPGRQANVPPRPDILLLGSSRAMGKVYDRITRVAPYPYPVRIEGPTGSGKRLAAEWLHRLSGRVGPFRPCYVNAMDDTLVLSTLCGHVRGAFTTAYRDKTGEVELAHQGTLLVDEIGAASPTIQLRLRQMIEDGWVRRVGDERERPVNVRWVFATNVNLEEAVRAGRFQQDLYQRMGKLVITMPALAARSDDIPELAVWVLNERAAEAGVPARPLGPTEMEQLMAYDWPGNLRELNNCMIAWLVNGELPRLVPKRPKGETEWRRRLGEAMMRHQGNIARVAAELGVSRPTVYSRLEKLGPV